MSLREMLQKPHLTSEHAEGTQPCSVLDNLWSGAKGEQSHRERESKAAQLFICICQAPVT